MKYYGAVSVQYIPSFHVTPKEAIRMFLCNEGSLDTAEIQERTGFHEKDIKKYINELIEGEEIFIDPDSGKYSLTPIACKDLYDRWGSLVE